MMDAGGSRAPEVRYDGDLDALVVAVYGTRSFEQARSHFTGLIDKLRENETRRLLLDLSQARYDFDLDEAVEAFAEIARPTGGLQIALVLDPSQREHGVIMQTAAASHWNLVRLFHDCDAARAWLDETRG